MAGTGLDENENLFYITLESGGCTDRFKDNKASDFTNYFQRPYHLQGRWQVALRRFTYEHSWRMTETPLHVELTIFREDTRGAEKAPPGGFTFLRQDAITGEKDNFSTNINSADTLKIDIPPDTYHNPEAIAELMCDLFAREISKLEPYAANLRPINFNKSKHVNLFEFTTDLAAVNLIFRKDNRLGTILGFDVKHANYDKKDVFIYQFTMRVRAPHPAHRHTTKALYIYLPDIIREESVGGAECALLQTVTPESEQGERKMVSFDTLDWKYIKPDVSEFSQLSIRIRDHTGKLITFQVGTTSATLVFRRAT